MIKSLLRNLLAGAVALAASNAFAFDCSDLWSFVGRSCAKAAAAWDHGGNEVILTGYAYHLRSTYTEEKLRELNEKAYGGGWSRTITDPDGDTHTLFAFGFHESHRKIQWNVGYLYSTYWGPQDGLQPGIGIASFIVQRPDIASGVPIPVFLPIASLKYGKATLMVTYIPTVNNGINNGSVVFGFGRVAF
ncbi:MAG: phospholipid:lipid A palmitoyltransferase [Casimicrobiaceae bacterium]